MSDQDIENKALLAWARIPKREALECYKQFPDTSWETRDLFWVLQQPVNDYVHTIRLNESLLESVRRDGFLNPFLMTTEYFALTGMQRLRCASELPIEVQKNTEIKICKLLSSPHLIFRHFPEEQAGEELARAYLAILEVCFKSLFFKEDFDKEGKEMIEFETKEVDG